MNLKTRDYLRVAREGRLFVLLGLVAGLVGAVAFTLSTPPEYSAQVTIYISAEGGVDSAVAAYQGSLLSEQKVKSYTWLLTSESVAQDVVDRLNLSVPASVVAGEIGASTQPDTVLLTATVTDRSPLLARDIANATGAAFTDLVTRLEKPSGNAPALVTARVVQPAVLPVAPVTPRPVLDICLGVLLGLLVGYGAALLRQAMDTTFKAVDDLQRLTDAPDLGIIGYAADVPKHPLIVQRHPRSTHAESYRKIRTNLQYIDVDRPRKTITVTSAVPEEGKTTMVCNLAIVLAQAGRRVVLVESDLRRPRVVDYLGLEGAVGVTTVLAGRVSFDQAVQPWGAELFDVLASGPLPPNPSDLLASGQMANLLADLGQRYDTVLLDAPPLLPVTDAAILGAAGDGVLLVVRHGRTTRNQVRAAMSALHSVSVPLLGTVLSMAPVSKSAPYYQAYHSAAMPPEQDWDETVPTTVVLAGPPTGRAGQDGDANLHERMNRLPVSVRPTGSSRAR